MKLIELRRARGLELILKIAGMHRESIVLSDHIAFISGTPMWKTTRELRGSPQQRAAM